MNDKVRYIKVSVPMSDDILAVARTSLLSDHGDMILVWANEGDLLRLGSDYTPPPLPVLGPNWGHGHVRPRPDGQRARCGGPAICPVCATEQAQALRAQAAGTDKRPLCPHGWVQTECEACNNATPVVVFFGNYAAARDACRAVNWHSPPRVHNTLLAIHGFGPGTVVVLVHGWERCEATPTQILEFCTARRYRVLMAQEFISGKP